MSSVRCLLGELGVGALQRGVDRGDGGLERLGDLRGRPAQHVAQDQHRALPGRQVLQRGDEGEPDRVALGDHDRRVGHRLEPRDLGVELEGVAGHLVGRAEPGGERPAGPALEVGQADVGGDPVEPGAHRRRPWKSALRLPRAQEGLLDEVLGLVEPTRSSGSSAPAARAGSAWVSVGSRPARVVVVIVAVLIGRSSCRSVCLLVPTGVDGKLIGDPSSESTTGQRDRERAARARARSAARGRGERRGRRGPGRCGYAGRAGRRRRRRPRG